MLRVKFAFISVKRFSVVLCNYMLTYFYKLIFFSVFMLFSEYTDDNALIPKNSSVIVRRIPIGGVKATSKTYVM